MWRGSKETAPASGPEGAVLILVSPRSQSSVPLILGSWTGSAPNSISHLRTLRTESVRLQHPLGLPALPALLSCLTRIVSLASTLAAVERLRTLPIFLVTSYIFISVTVLRLP